MNNKVDIEKCAKVRDAILKNTNTNTATVNTKPKKVRTKFYDRKLIRNILRNQLKTNKIKGVFHDKEQVSALLRTL